MSRSTSHGRGAFPRGDPHVASIDLSEPNSDCTTVTVYWYYIMQTALALICVGSGASIARIVLDKILAAKDASIGRLTQRNRDLLRWVRVGVRDHGLQVDPWVEREIARLEGRRDD